jgi:predicted nucleic acid-binding Zn ribbon protein
VTLDRSIGPRCNIGPAEIARRRRSAIAFTVVAALVAVALVAFDVPPPGRLILFPFATGAAINWLQVVHRFCVAFGAFGIENFGPIGSEAHVDPAQRAADRRRVAQLVLEGSLIGVVVTVVLLVSPA